MEDEGKYPLDQLVAIKQRRLEAAEKLLADKKAILAKEEEKLEGLEKKRDEVKEHKEQKLFQFREKIDAGISTDKIQQMRQYLKMVTEQLKAEEIKVRDQQKIVDAALQAVEAARQDLFKKQKDVEKLKMHHKEWEKELRASLEHKEGVQTDEMGSAMHVIHKAKKKKQHG